MSGHRHVGAVIPVSARHWHAVPERRHGEPPFKATCGRGGMSEPTGWRISSSTSAGRDDVDDFPGGWRSLTRGPRGARPSASIWTFSRRRSRLSSPSNCRCARSSRPVPWHVAGAGVDDVFCACSKDPAVISSRSAASSLSADAHHGKGLASRTYAYLPISTILYRVAEIPRRRTACRVRIVFRSRLAGRRDDHVANTGECLRRHRRSPDLWRRACSLADEPRLEGRRPEQLDLATFRVERTRCARPGSSLAAPLSHGGRAHCAVQAGSRRSVCRVVAAAGGLRMACGLVAAAEELERALACTPGAASTTNWPRISTRVTPSANRFSRRSNSVIR